MSKQTAKPESDASRDAKTNLERLNPLTDDGLLIAIIETPKGHRNKYTYDPELNAFELKGVLPTGAVFPYDFGFLPRTLGEDGDPLDVLVLMEDAAFPGCFVRCRLIGAIEAEQSTKDGTSERNDRLIAVLDKSPEYKGVDALNDLPTTLLDQIEHFFVSYNVVKGREFTPIGRSSASKALALVKEGVKRYDDDSRGK